MRRLVLWLGCLAVVGVMLFQAYGMRRDLNGRPVVGAQVAVAAWTIWYEPEEEVGEDCETIEVGCDYPEAEGQDRLMRGPSFETKSACDHALTLMMKRVASMDIGDGLCLPTAQGNPHLCSGEGHPPVACVHPK